MKNLVFPILALLVATLCIAAFPTDAEARIYEDTLRLHILANSDTAEDQQLKLQIRDKILNKYGEALSGQSSKSEAAVAAAALLPKIEDDVEEWIRAEGHCYSVRATLTEEWYDTREYENFTLPAGIYSSLRIILGSGEGQNWWCVMYPPLCMDIATEKAPADDGFIDYSKEEVRLISSGKYTVKFKILEILSSAFAKNG